MSTPPSGQEGWGKGVWGTSQWGSGITPPPEPPVIIPLAPLPDEVGVPQQRPIAIRFTDNAQVSFSSIKVSVSGTIYVMGGSAQNGATLEAEVNDENGFDIEIRLPEAMAIGSRQEVVADVADNDGDTANRVWFFSVGVGPRLIQVVNPRPGVLLAQFNEAMLLNEAFLTPANWRVTAVSEGALPLIIEEVYGIPAQANVAVLHYSGGGSTYELEAVALTAHDGDPLQIGFNTAVFELIYGAEEDPVIRVFNTIFGPIGIRQRAIKRRSIEDHSVRRSIALGLDEQMRLKGQSLDGTAGRDGRPGTRRL